ncbi:MAG: ABC transporter ATP-binding protein [Cyanobacteriota bacterium]|nr:ABC transporter ATP-binding protein [Cyanobacteriota bacterium]
MTNLTDPCLLTHSQPQGSPAPLVTVQGVSKIYPVLGRDPVVALHHVSLEVAAGEFIALIGPSGCGKTTLLRILADLDQPTQGTVQMAGRSPQQARQDRLYGYIFQAPTLLEWRTALQNVLLPLQVMNWPAAERLEKARTMLKLVGLELFHHNYPWQLSGGMQQRVSIARALAFDPDVLLMDEPFGALDEITREKMNLELLRLWEATHKTIFFVTHSIQEAVFLSTRVVVMTPNPGQIAQIIPIDLPQPRGFETWKDPRFFQLTTQVLESLREVYA